MISQLILGRFKNIFCFFTDYEFLFDDACDGPTSTYSFGGKDIQNGESTNACYELCKNSANCEFFTLEPVPKQCHLYPTPISSNSNSNPPNGFTSTFDCYRMLRGKCK